MPSPATLIAPVRHLSPVPDTPEKLKGFVGGQNVVITVEQPYQPHAQSEALLSALRDNRSRVIDIFRRLDKDLSGAVDRTEWRQIIVFVSKERRDSGEFDSTSIDATFDLLDADGSGSLDLHELDHLLRAGFETVLARKLQKGAAGEIVLEAKNAIELRAGPGTMHRPGTYSGGGHSAAGGTATAHQRDLRSGSYEVIKEGQRIIANAHTIEAHLDLDADGDGQISDDELAAAAKVLRTALSENAVRVIDLFRDWDVNGDGAVSFKEFVMGVTLLGFPGDRAAAMLFREWDSDGSGSLQVLAC
jgi:Ca2+-binding EF-hand superfamily protein